MTGDDWPCAGHGVHVVEEPDVDTCVDCGPLCRSCGYPSASFACKVRHVGISIGWGRAANE